MRGFAALSAAFLILLAGCLQSPQTQKTEVAFEGTREESPPPRRDSNAHKPAWFTMDVVADQDGAAHGVVWYPPEYAILPDPVIGNTWDTIPFDLIPIIPEGKANELDFWALFVFREDVPGPSFWVRVLEARCEEIRFTEQGPVEATTPASVRPQILELKEPIHPSVPFRFVVAAAAASPMNFSLLLQLREAVVSQRDQPARSAEDVLRSKEGPPMTIIEGENAARARLVKYSDRSFLMPDGGLSRTQEHCGAASGVRTSATADRREASIEETIGIEDTSAFLEGATFSSLRFNSEAAAGSWSTSFSCYGQSASTEGVILQPGHNLIAPGPVLDLSAEGLGSCDVEARVDIAVSVAKNFHFEKIDFDRAMTAIVGAPLPPTARVG